MENATQALLIAGGILFGIIALTLLVYSFNTISVVGNAKQRAEETERLAEWNGEWEAYNKQLLYGTEVLTVINKARQNNISDETAAYPVIIYVRNMNGTEEYDSSSDYANASKLAKDNKTNIFKCTGVEHNNDAGRVSSMTFQIIKEVQAPPI